MTAGPPALESTSGRPAVYTALFGGYDTLPTHADQDVAADWICFTDDAGVQQEGWTTVVAPSRYEHPRMSAKWFKALPHAALPDHRWTIWIDANMHVDSAGFVREALELSHTGLGVFRHPQRKTVRAEARASLRTAPAKYAGEPLLRQVDEYRREGFPDNVGLFALGTIVRDSSQTEVRTLGDEWLAECERWSYQDQLSFPVVLWRLGLTPSVFPYHQHRHGLLDGFSCALHRIPMLDAAAVALRSRRPKKDGPISAVTPGATTGATWPRSNPWWTLTPHRSDA